MQARNVNKIASKHSSAMRDVTYIIYAVLLGDVHYLGKDGALFLGKFSNRL